MSTAVVLYTRDLRVHDHAALASAAEQYDTVLPREVTSGGTSPDLPSGGERASRRRLERWLADGLQLYVALLVDRARFVVAAFLTTTLRLDWRHGARAFADLSLTPTYRTTCVTGNGSREPGGGHTPQPTLQPKAQARRNDSSGDYVRRYVPELAELAAHIVHEPWRVPLARVAPEYPAPSPS